MQWSGYNQRRTAAAVGLSYDQLRGLVRKYKLASKATPGNAGVTIARK